MSGLISKYLSRSIEIRKYISFLIEKKELEKSSEKEK